MSPLAWAKLGMVVAVIVAIGWLGWRVQAWHVAYEELPRAREALTLEQDCGEGSRCAERTRTLLEKADEERLQAVTGLANELAALRARPVRTRTVRVCPDDGGMPGAGAATGVDGGAAAPGELHGSAGRDIGPELYALAAEADEVAARCRALQGWNRALAAPQN